MLLLRGNNIPRLKSIPLTAMSIQVPVPLSPKNAPFSNIPPLRDPSLCPGQTIEAKVSQLIAHLLDDLEFQLFKVPLVTQH